MLLTKDIYFVMIFLFTFCINKHEMINVIISAIGKVTHITALPAFAFRTSCAKAHATGRTNTSCLPSETIRDSTPLPSA